MCEYRFPNLCFVQLNNKCWCTIAFSCICVHDVNRSTFINKIYWFGMEAVGEGQSARMQSKVGLTQILQVFYTKPWDLLTELESKHTNMSIHCPGSLVFWQRSPDYFCSTNATDPVAASVSLSCASLFSSLNYRWQHGTVYRLCCYYSKWEQLNQHLLVKKTHQKPAEKWIYFLKNNSEDKFRYLAFPPAN